MTKKTIFSGIQPTGIPTLGSFLGAIKQWEKLSTDYDCLYCVVDSHSITVRQDPATLREKSRDLLIQYIALGLDPEEHNLYYQSHVPAHSELSWILSCFTYMGELGRMTQYKDKSQRNEENINAGLFTYPVLQAADILLFQTDMVPVGEDQKQHLELCRDVAIRFNNVYGEIFTVPEPYIAPLGARIMSLQEPEKKMSKSDATVDKNNILLMDSPDVIIKKFKRAMTDSTNEIRYNPAEQPGVSNLLTIYACATGRTIEQSVADFANSPGYGHLKTRVGEAVVEMLAPMHKRYAELKADTAYIDSIIKKNAERASNMAEHTLAAAKEAVGFPKP